MPIKYLKQNWTFFSNTPNSRILKFRILSLLIHIYGTAKTDLVANFIELGHVETCSEEALTALFSVHPHYDFIVCDSIAVSLFVDILVGFGKHK